MDKKYLALFLFAFVGIASAAWVLYYDSGITGYVIGGADGEMIFVDDFSFEENNDSLAFEKTENLTITNNDGVANLTIKINTTIIDVQDSCNNTGDVDVVVEYKGQELSDGDIITVQSGISNIETTTSAKERSCPQEVMTKLTLDQLP